MNKLSELDLDVVCLTCYFNGILGVLWVPYATAGPLNQTFLWFWCEVKRFWFGRAVEDLNYNLFADLDLSILCA